MTAELDALVIAGKAHAEAITPVQHGPDCVSPQWVTRKRVESNDIDGYEDIGDDEAVCEHCGAESTVTDTDTEKNVVVDIAGAEAVANYLAGNVQSDFVYMKLGSTATVTAPAESDTQLSNTVTISPSLSATVQATGGASKKVVWSHTFSSATGRSSVVSLAMDTGTGTGTLANILNRVTFPAKDNANNDLAMTYELTVS